MYIRKIAQKFLKIYSNAINYTPSQLSDADKKDGHQICVCDYLDYRYNLHYLMTLYLINTFKPEFTIVIFIHYKPRIAVAIYDL